MTPLIIFCIGMIISFCMILICTDYYDHQGSTTDFIKHVKDYMEKGEWK